LILGQLWYGWAPRGVEGVNKEQIIAGSGKLGSRSNPLTQLVLPWCYYQKAESRGWLERNGVGVAFRRTPTGRDARGRLGAFFVHALVWEPGTMPAKLLAGLWDATVWETHPPAEPPAQLEPISSVEQLGLLAALPTDRHAEKVVLAGTLENLAGSRRTTLDFPVSEAYALAAGLAATMPAKFGLMSFSSHEQQDKAGAYDIVTGPSPGTGHATVGPAASPDAPWLQAAALLLDASDGAPQSGALVEMIAAQANSLSEFAHGIRRWVDIEASSVSPEALLDSESLGWLSRAPSLMGSLLRRKRARGVVRAFIAGHGGDLLVQAVRRSDSIGEFVTVLRGELSADAPTEVVPCLSRLERSFPVQARALALELVEPWRADQLKELSPEQAVTLVQLLAAEPQPGSLAVRIVEDLATAPEAAAALTVTSSLPADWRARAAATHPAHIAPSQLVSAMIDQRRFAPTFISRSGQPGLEALGAAIAEAPISSALRCAERAAAHLSVPEDRIQLLWPVILRLGSADRLIALSRHAPRDALVAAAWTDLAVTALVDTVLDGRDARLPLPNVAGPAFTVGLLSTTPRIASWQRLGGVVLDTSTRSVEAAAREISRLDSDREKEAAIEILVDAICENNEDRPSEWLSAITALVGTVAEPDELAAYLARASLRAGGGDRSQIALWTIWWVAGAIDRGSISPGFTRDPAMTELPQRLRLAYIPRLEEFRDQHERRSASARWLKRIEKDLRKRFDS
jgi:hypothetical protein